MATLKTDLRMPNRKTHFIIGSVTGAALGLASQLDRLTEEPPAPVDWRRILMCAAIGGFVAVLPDVIEPAVTPNHRAFAHSITTAALLVSQVPQMDGRDGTAAANAAIVGYLSHLGADALTPRSLPLI